MLQTLLFYGLGNLIDMNESLLYISNADSISLLLSLFFYSVFMFTGVFLIYKSKKMEGKSKYLFPLVVGGLLFFWTIGEGITMYGNYSVLSALRKHQYYTVEGRVSNFHENPKIGHEKEYFYLNNIYFELHGDRKKLETLFYSKNRVWGGVIEGDGQKIKIYYINYLGDNKIIKISKPL